MATHGSPARRRRRRTGSRDPPGEKSGGLLEDLDLLLEPLVLALQPLQLGLLGLAGGQRLRRAGRQVLVAPPAQLPGAQAELRRDLAQPLAAVQQAPDRLGLELGGEPPPLLPLRHPTLLRCSGSLANPPLLRGRSSLCTGRTPRPYATAAQDRARPHHLVLAQGRPCARRARSHPAGM